MNNDFYYNETDGKKLPNEFKTGLAIASFVLSLVNFICCMCSCSFIFAPVSIILGVISLVTHRGGKVFSVLGIVISSVALVFFGFFMSIYMKIYPDLVYFQENSTAVISEYEESGKIPEQYEKYRTEKYDKYWNAMQCEDFDEFFKLFIESYLATNGISETSVAPENQEESRDRETPVELNYTGAVTGMKFLMTA